MTYETVSSAGDSGPPPPWTNSEPKACRVFIGMPVFNGCPYIEDALNSLTSQTFQDWRLLIADNCSTDATADVCRRFVAADSRITYVRHEKNQGAAYNFKYVLDAADSEFFMWAAHDDTWQPQYLATGLELLDHSCAEYAFSGFALASIRWRFRKQVPTSLFDFIGYSNPSTRVIAFANLHHHSHKCNLVYSLFRKRFIAEVWRIQDISNDTLMSMVILEKAAGEVVKACLFTKRYIGLWPGWQHNTPLAPWRDASRYLAPLDRCRARTLSLFPKYVPVFELINQHYHSCRSLPSFRVVPPSMLNISSECKT